ncbi:uncharacterized protein TNIN_241941 [Trichonephila inaurata madagascariensis]|uniref:THAP-type domain-containing protein n=1 Tax=Trichonephila inaurata madagascariensis TaxID=2747483 RepID=A0A8X6XVC8_9ARAC|nr:uncharacterized protein TNIN_241941 [Trichonephila inaurata madagascariensis]
MAYCSANGCNNSKRKESCRSKSFFKFPSKNPTILKTWVKMMKRERFEPGPSSVLCSDHFEEECFEYQNFTNRRQLKAGSIPTIFGFTKSPSSRRILDRYEPSTSAEIYEPPVSNEVNAAMATEEIQAEMLNKAPKTSAERGRAFRALKALLKQQSKQQQEPDAIVEISTEDIRSAGPSEDNQVPGPSEIRTIEKRAKSAEATRRWREKKKGISESSKKQAKTVAQRMREYRKRKKLAKKIRLKQQSDQDLDAIVSTSSSQLNQRAGPSTVNSISAELTRRGNSQSQQQIETSERAQEYRERRNDNINIEWCKMTSEEKSFNSSNKKFIEEIQSCLLEEPDEKEGDRTIIGCQEEHFEDAYDIDDTEEIEENNEDFHTEQRDSDSNYDDEDEKDCFMAFRKESGEIIDSMRWEKNPYFNNQRITKKYHFSGPSGVEGPAKNANGILETWKCLFDDGMLDMIVMFTNQNIDLIRSNYIRVRDVAPTDAAEIQAFIGLLYLSALYKTNLNLWDSDGFGVEIFRLTMSFKRFQFLSGVIRFDSTETSLERKSFDRLAPIRDLFEKFVLNCQSCYSVGEHVTLDEKLEPFRGKCSFLRYVPSKPGKYAIKIFALVDTKTLYTSNMEIYCGKQPEGPYALSNDSLDVVNRMIAPISHSGRNVTASSWFGDVPLMKTLSEDHHLSFVGAIKKNKWQIPYRFKNTTSRKVFSSIFAYRREGTLVSYVVQNEKNKNNILLISSKHLKGNIDETMEDKKTPEMVSFYNQTKNAVDTVSKMCSTYNVARQTKRWPVVIFYSLLNTAGINSQILYLEKENKIVSRREFLKCLGKELINDQLKHRAKISCLPQSISSRLHEILPKTEQLDDTEMVMDNTCDLNISRKRCRPCAQEKRDRRSRFSCYMCGSYLCLQHCGFVCQNGCATKI